MSPIARPIYFLHLSFSVASRFFGFFSGSLFIPKKPPSFSGFHICDASDVGIRPPYFSFSFHAFFLLSTHCVSVVFPVAAGFGAKPSSQEKIRNPRFDIIHFGPTHVHSKTQNPRRARQGSFFFLAPRRCRGATHWRRFPSPLNLV